MTSPRSAAGGVQRGCLVIGDISGYTAFLAGSELDHARGILDGLLGALVESLSPPLVVAKLEGDAVFCHAPEGVVEEGQTLLQTIEHAYDAFRSTREIMAANTTCGCRACAQIQDLSLKFVAHHGEYAHSRIGESPELTGSDVVLVHRLLKNDVAAVTGVHDYALLTDVTLDALGLRGHLAPGLPYAEEVEHLGRVDAAVHDLHAGHDDRARARPLVVPPADAWITLGIDVPVSPARAWEYVTLPQYRALLLESDRVDELPHGARRGRGTVYHCVHGNDVFSHTILEWCPHDLYTFEGAYPLGGRQLSTIELRPAPGGTHIEVRVGRMRGPTPLHSALLRLMDIVMIHQRDMLQRGMERLRQRMTDDAAGAG